MYNQNPSAPSPAKKLWLKKMLLALTFCFLAGSSSTAGAATSDDVPLSIGGFKLGESIDEYDFISYRNFLKQVVIEQIPGFRKGMIEYGVCDRPGKIVRIKLKYKDPSKKFFAQLMTRYREKFGEPDQFTGDPFGIVKSWKWYFKDKDGQRVSITLQNNLKNTNETIGNMVKLSLPDQIEAERECFNKTCSRKKGGNCFTPSQPQGQERPWKMMIPQ